jgi:hypothetical protein
MLIAHYEFSSRGSMAFADLSRGVFFLRVRLARKVARRRPFAHRKHLVRSLTYQPTMTAVVRSPFFLEV